MDTVWLYPETFFMFKTVVTQMFAGSPILGLQLKLLTLSLNILPSPRRLCFTTCVCVTVGKIYWTDFHETLRSGASLSFFNRKDRVLHRVTYPTGNLEKSCVTASMYLFWINTSSWRKHVDSCRCSGAVTIWQIFCLKHNSTTKDGRTRRTCTVNWMCS